ncbi:MAG: UMP kinase [Thermomicrobia bacterium]|nr:UMP kinase [Thermomicrobia bacterium]
MTELKYRRVLLKLSGEAFEGEGGRNIDPVIVHALAAQVRDEVADGALQMAIVAGGGNFWRGRNAEQLGMDRATADYMGMIGTVINALALQESLERAGVQTRVMTAIQMQQVAEPYIRRRALRHMEKGRVVILAGGNGNPYFTTDTTGALRALELECDVLLMGKHGVDGIYDRDPKKYPDAIRFAHISYAEALRRELGVMDSTAFALCMDNNLPIIVFNIQQPGMIARVLRGEEGFGTVVR